MLLGARAQARGHPGDRAAWMLQCDHGSSQSHLNPLTPRPGSTTLGPVGNTADGSKRNLTMGTRGNIAEKSISDETSILTFTFSDKTEMTYDVREHITADLGAETCAAIVEKAPWLIEEAVHGVSQKVGDSYASAGQKSEEAGLTPLAWAKRVASAVLDSIKKGVFTRAGTGGGGEPSLLAAACARVTGSTIEEAEATVEAMTKEQTKAAKAMPEIAAAIATIQAERAQARLDRAKAAAEAAAKAASTATATGAAISLGDLTK